MFIINCCISKYQVKDNKLIKKLWKNRHCWQKMFSRKSRFSADISRKTVGKCKQIITMKLRKKPNLTLILKIICYNYELIIFFSKHTKNYFTWMSLQKCPCHVKKISRKVRFVRVKNVRYSCFEFGEFCLNSAF
jgi:hypothetical protein